MLPGACNKNPKEQAAKYTDFERGSYYYYINKDSAFLMYNRYVNNADDTLKKGMAYRLMGDILWKAGDLYGAEENGAASIHTLDTLNKKHRPELGYAYNLLGDINLDLKNYDEAVNMYDHAINLFKGDAFMLETMNGKATTLQKKGAYTNAIAVYDSILVLNPANQSLVARAIDNKARTKWLQNPAYPVLPEFWLALKIRTDSQYHAGLNASYAHLADYYENNNPDSALAYAKLMFQQAQVIQKPEDRLEAMDKLIRLSKTPDLKEYWFASYKRLNDSVHHSRDTTRARFAVIRYDFQKSKADNLELREQNRNQRLWMYTLAIAAIIVFTAIRSRYIKRRRKIEQDAENEIRDSRLKTSQKVHDVVANGLYSVMNELEHSATIERETLINKIEVLYERSRDISYEPVAAGTAADHKKMVHELLESFAGEKHKLFIVGNEPAFWNSISPNQQQQLQLVLTEIMINMKKHSGAGKVAIGFKTANTHAVITYRDDGTGFPLNHQFGNGLTNTVSRIKSINGEINFGKSDSGGASITISFPLQPVQHD